MGGENWSLTPKPCDSCRTAPAAVFCRPDSAFLCITCDGRFHAANKLASRHPRVWMCHVCEQAPATVTCKADAAALCDNCDGDIHSANPLARRHHRLPIVPFYDAVKSSHPTEAFSEEEVEVEAASWILPDPNTKQAEDSGSPGLFRDVVPYLDLDLISEVQKSGQLIVKELKQYSSDGVVPVEEKNEFGSGQYTDPVVDGFPAYNMDCSGSKPAMFSFTSPSISQTVSCSSFDVGLVPDHNTLGDVRKDEDAPTRAVGLEREARVLRYKEKRKNRTFNKIVRYASRKAYAETRPRIKGRFAKRSELEADVCYGIVPTL